MQLLFTRGSTSKPVIATRSIPECGSNSRNPSLMGLVCSGWFRSLLIPPNHDRKKTNSVLLREVSVSWHLLKESVAFEFLEMKRPHSQTLRGPLPDFHLSSAVKIQSARIQGSGDNKHCQIQVGRRATKNWQTTHAGRS